MQFVKQSVIRAAAERVFGFHEQPEALALLTPAWEHARVIQPAKISEVGSTAIVHVSVFGLFTVKWVAEHTVYEPPHFFEDIQIKGPFKSWRHRHIIKPAPEGTLLRDEIEYEPPLGFIGRLFVPIVIERRLQKLFNHRHDVARRWCEAISQDDLKS
jgi:ligand-binding SRPBCC domain-containing protein